MRVSFSLEIIVLILKAIIYENSSSLQNRLAANPPKDKPIVTFFLYLFKEVKPLIKSTL